VFECRATDRDLAALLGRDAGERSGQRLAVAQDFDGAEQWLDRRWRQ